MSFIMLSAAVLSVVFLLLCRASFFRVYCAECRVFEIILSFIMLSGIMLSGIMLNGIMLSGMVFIVMLSINALNIIMLFCYAERYYAECRVVYFYAECRYGECRGGKFMAGILHLSRSWYFQDSLLNSVMVLASHINVPV